MNPPLDLLHLRNADTIGDLDGVASRALGRLAGQRLADLGYRQFEDPWEATLRVYRLDSPVALRVPLTEFRERVLEIVRVVLDETLAARDGERGIRRVAATKAALTEGARGARTWERLAVEHARDCLPEIERDDAHAADVAGRAVRAARAAERAAERSAADGTPRERERAARATSRAAQRAATEADLRWVLRAWLPASFEDAVEIGDVWTAWRGSLADASPSFAKEHPLIVAAGRTTFYRVVCDLLDTRTIAGRRRLVVVPHGLRVRLLLRRGQRLAALQLQRDRLDREAAGNPTS